MSDKSFISILMVIPKLLTMEHSRGSGRVMRKQWGFRNMVLIFYTTIKNVGLLNSLQSIFRFRLSKIASSFWISMWEVFGDREAIIVEDKRFTFSEFKDRVFRLSNALQSLGLKPMDKFAEMLYNGNEFFEALNAGSLIGCPMAFLNWHMKGDELSEAINRVSPRLLIIHEDLVKNVVAVKRKLKSVEFFIVVGKNAPKNMIVYENLLSESSNTKPETNFILAASPFTGGTTGVPKNVNYFDGMGYLFSDSAERPRSSFKEYLRFLVMQGSLSYWYNGADIHDPITHNIRCLVPGPLYHAGVMAGWAPFMIYGGTVIPMVEFDPEEFLEIVERERISWVFVVPTMLDRILDLPKKVKNKYNLSSMRALICAAAPASPELKKAANSFFIERGCKGNVFMEYYGSAETGVTTVLTPKDYEENPKRYASVGKPRCGETRIYNSETGEWCKPNEEGKVLTRTVMTISLRYSGTPEKLQSAYEVVNGVHWFDDGLLGYMDEDEFLYLTGRVKEMIISGGVNVYPNEIETDRKSVV